MEDIEEERQQH
jgi:hypothetical protein